VDVTFMSRTTTSEGYAGRCAGEEALRAIKHMVATSTIEWGGSPYASIPIPDWIDDLAGFSADALVAQNRPFVPRAIVFYGLSSRLDGCPGGKTVFSADGQFLGSPATYEIRVKRKMYLGATSGFEEQAVYTMVVKPITFLGPQGLYGGPALVDCTDGSYVFLGVGPLRSKE
jgi:hypothetical protein